MSKNDKKMDIESKIRFEIDEIFSAVTKDTDMTVERYHVDSNVRRGRRTRKPKFVEPVVN